MGITRTFLGWTRHPLPALSDRLLGNAEPGATLDLSDRVVVVPGAAASRRLLELLVEQAGARKLVLLPPEIVTIGALPERLYLEQKPFANPLTQQFAWIEALQAVPREVLAPFFPHLPSSGEIAAWLPFAQMLQSLHRELAADALDFSDVVEQGTRLEDFPERPRWQALRRVQVAYLEVLDRLALWDRQTARRYAIEHRECRSERAILLVGTVDLNRAMRLMLDQVADRVEAIVFAPRELASRFDEHGCLIPKAWPFPLAEPRDDQIRVVTSPGDQADELLRSLAELEGRIPPEEIVVGVPEPALTPYLEQRLESARIESRNGVGRTARETSVGKFLTQLADWLDEQTVVEFQNLLRHPAVEEYLHQRSVRGDWLTQLDNYRSRHLQMSLGKRWLGKAEETGLLRTVWEEIQELLAGWKSGERRLSEWGEPLAALLGRLFDRAEPSRGKTRELTEVAGAVRQALEMFGEIPESLEPRISGAGFLRMLLAEISQTTIPPEPNPHAVELLGWLELPWIDSEVLIVTGMNEGVVPSSRNADLFLPNRLRQLLELEDNDRRYARDAYFLSLLTASRTHLVLIAGRVSATRDPLIPSRLLFGETQSTIVDRTLRFFGEHERSRRPVPGQTGPGRARAEFRPPRLDSYVVDVVSMRVTEFKDYLQCPYRYFLRHRLKLESTVPTSEELDPGAFGGAIHLVLQKFGENEEVRQSTDEQTLVALLNRELDGLIRGFYGSDPEPAVRLQAERIRARLHAFARWQVTQSASGWEIEHVEVDVTEEHGVNLDVDGAPMNLRGRIDRIDVHRESGIRRIYDYKSSDSAKDPRKSHYRPKKGEWIDLQLPLYRHLVRALGIGGELELGYINLPKKLEDVKDSIAFWTEEELADADEQARRIVRAIRENQFWPPGDDPGLMAEFAEICLESILGSDEDDEEDSA
jgi:ATP-dependent helicase/nuclease subunit B